MTLGWFNRWIAPIIAAGLMGMAIWAGMNGENNAATVLVVAIYAGSACIWLQCAYMGWRQRFLEAEELRDRLGFHGSSYGLEHLRRIEALIEAREKMERLLEEKRQQSEKERAGITWETFRDR